MTHIRTKKKVPTPNCIIELIDPPKEKMSGHVYSELCRRIRDGSVFVSDDERKYISDYETLIIGKDPS